MLTLRVCIAALALANGVAAARLAEQTAASSRARAWLSEHQDPDAAGMNDLKQSDPNAFAIVQALLTKQKLGLLDPSHPSASFTGGAPHSAVKSFAQEAKAAGITEDTPIRELSGESSVGSSLAQEDVVFPSVPRTHDPWSFHASKDDDSLVQSLLATPEEPKSGSLLSKSSGSQSSTSSSASSSMEGMPSLEWSSPYSSAPDHEDATHQSPQQLAVAEASGDKAVEKLEDNSFHKIASSFRTEATQAADKPLPDDSASLGDTFSKDLAAAKKKRWETALEVSPLSKQEKPKTEYMQESSASDDSNSMSQEDATNAIDGFLDSFVAPTLKAKPAAKAAAAARVNPYMSVFH